MHSEPLPHERLPGSTEEWRFDLANNPLAMTRMEYARYCVAMNDLQTDASPSADGEVSVVISGDDLRQVAEASKKTPLERDHTAWVDEARRSTLRHFMVVAGLGPAEAHQRLIADEQVLLKKLERQEADQADRAAARYIRLTPPGDFDHYAQRDAAWARKVQQDLVKEQAERRRTLQQTGDVRGNLQPQKWVLITIGIASVAFWGTLIGCLVYLWRQ